MTRNALHFDNITDRWKQISLSLQRWVSQCDDVTKIAYTDFSHRSATAFTEGGIWKNKAAWPAVLSSALFKLFRQSLNLRINKTKWASLEIEVDLEERVTRWVHCFYKVSDTFTSENHRGFVKPILKHPSLRDASTPRISPFFTWSHFHSFICEYRQTVWNDSPLNTWPIFVFSPIDTLAIRSTVIIMNFCR